jgi:hypothetical protein
MRRVLRAGRSALIQDEIAYLRNVQERSAMRMQALDYRREAFLPYRAQSFGSRSPSASRVPSPPPAEAGAWDPPEPGFQENSSTEFRSKVIGPHGTPGVVRVSASATIGANGAMTAERQYFNSFTGEVIVGQGGGLVGQESRDDLTLVSLPLTRPQHCRGRSESFRLATSASVGGRLAW